MALIPMCNTPTDGRNIEVSRKNEYTVAHGNQVLIEIILKCKYPKLKYIISFEWNSNTSNNQISINFNLSSHANTLVFTHHYFLLSCKNGGGGATKKWGEKQKQCKQMRFKKKILKLNCS